MAKKTNQQTKTTTISTVQVTVSSKKKRPKKGKK